MTEVRHVRVGDVTLGNDLPLALIAGPVRDGEAGVMRWKPPARSTPWRKSSE